MACFFVFGAPCQIRRWRGRSTAGPSHYRKFRDDGRVPCFGGPTDIDEPAAYDFHYIDLDQRQSINFASTSSGHACLGGVHVMSVHPWFRNE
jgi:hypothetical protein